MKTEELGKLRDDGDTVELDDGTGRVVRLRIEPDQDTRIGDDDCYGQIGFDDRRRTNEAGYPMRPEGFDGNAERLYYGNDGPWWWQPPADGPKRSDPEFRQFRETVRELLAFGFCGLIVEVCEGEDAYSRPIVRDTASLWGIESIMNDEYRSEVIRDLLGEVGIEVED